MAFPLAYLVAIRSSLQVILTSVESNDKEGAIKAILQLSKLVGVWAGLS